MNDYTFFWLVLWAVSMIILVVLARSLVAVLRSIDDGLFVLVSLWAEEPIEEEAPKEENA